MMDLGLTRNLLLVLVFGIAAALTGCGADSGGNGTASDAPAAVPDEYLASGSPDDASDVLDTRSNSAAGEAVMLRGRVGGRRDPITENRAIFLMADVGLPACDANPDDRCPTPWDYCCVPRDELRRNLVTVQIVDEDGRPLAARFDPASGVKPGAEIVVEGEIASKDDSGSMIVNARKIYVAG